MSILLWCNHPRYAVSNDELWQQFFETSSVEERDYLLLLILTNAEDNQERWAVFDNTENECIRQDALVSMLPHAQKFDELWQIYANVPEDMEDLRDQILVAAEVLCRLNLHLAKHNSERWLVCKIAKNPSLKDEALLEILANSASDGECWKVFITTKTHSVRERAISYMFTRRKIKKK